MEAKRVRAIVIVSLVLGLLIGQSTASNFKDCYEVCFATCFPEKKDPIYCGGHCLRKCIFHPSSLDTQTYPKHFCKLGCATSLCNNISTKDNHNGGKVETCVDSCSRTCTATYKAGKH
ncbi:hypothetical protein PRUPE_3G073800 [Prunus persica]|uniref:Thionin-like protein 2 n=1 Tax=Prunus persica TaxID=3760 RepID=M5WW19_PRUPE|nr:hypothetical protein PRUPE_3G073800 [Prunus persica]